MVNRDTLMPDLSFLNLDFKSNHIKKLRDFTPCAPGGVAKAKVIFPSNHRKYFKISEISRDRPCLKNKDS